MAAADFALVTDWRLDAPPDAVWNAIVRCQDWPSWWPAVRRVETLERGDEIGLGAVRRITWRTALPYELTFDVRTVRVEPLRLIEGRAFGELDGTGIWTLTSDTAGTHVRYDWRVAVARPWMRLAAPLLRPAFAWNHGKVMGWGEQGLRGFLSRH